MRKYLDDLLIVSGCGAIVYGVWQLSPVAAWIVGGTLLVALGVLVGLGRVDDNPQSGKTP